jgi:hypothetical protein
MNSYELRLALNAAGVGWDPGAMGIGPTPLLSIVLVLFACSAVATPSTLLHFLARTERPREWGHPSSMG